MGNQLTVLDKLDQITGHSIDYEWTTFNRAYGDYNPQFVFNKQGDMYAVSQYHSCTLYSVNKYSGEFTPLLRLTDYDSTSRAATIWRVYGITADKDGHIYCLEGNPWENDWGSAYGWTEGRHIYKIDMTDPANPVAGWFTPGSAALAALMPKHDFGYRGLEIDDSGNFYFLGVPAGSPHYYPALGVVKIHPDGVTHELIAGDSTSKEMADGIGRAVKFHTPAAMTLDNYNNMFIFDLGPEQGGSTYEQVSRLRVLGLALPSYDTEVDVTEISSNLLSAYDKANSEVTNKAPVVVDGVSYPVMDMTPHVSMPKTWITLQVVL